PPPPGPEPRSGAGMAAYTASKAAVVAFTIALAEEVAKLGILVNAVAPSIMDTPANRAAMPKADHAAWPKVEEVAATILFLASPQNRVTRGAVVRARGKWGAALMLPPAPRRAPGPSPGASPRSRQRPRAAARRPR